MANDFQARHRLAGVAVSINDMGATPAVVSLRLDQAAAALPLGLQLRRRWPRMNRSFAECTARERVTHLLDADSFHEILGPSERVVSPHLALLGVPSAFDDGVVIGSGLLDGQPSCVAAQEGEFMGGGVGEVHGAKLVGLFKRALVPRARCGHRAGRVWRRASARGQCRADRGVGGDARPA